MARYSSDPRVSVAEFSATVKTAAGPVQIERRSAGAIRSWVAPHNRDGSWSALDTYHQDLDAAVDAVFARFGGAR